MISHLLKIKYIEYFIIFLYFIAILFHIKEFTVWSQITALLDVEDIETSIDILIDSFINIHPHFLRALLIFPFFVFANFLYLDLNTLFSIGIVIFIFLIYKLNFAILKNIVPRKYTMLILIFFIFLSFFMHGRIVFAIFGNTALLYLLYKNFYSHTKLTKMHNFLLFFFSLWSVSVSSGTFVVYLLTIIIFYFFYSMIQLPYISKKILWSLSLFFFLLIIISPILIVFINKNIDFYDGSVLNMLAHGTGRYLINYFYAFIPIAILFLLILYFMILYFRIYKFFILPISLIISSFLIGIFGFSSLVSGVSGYIILIYMLMYKNKFQEFYV